MRNFKNLSDYEIHEIWGENNWKSEYEIQKFREELIKRKFVSWDEISTKFECVELP